MSNLEIEDVLSSIRRLVSEDLRPSPRTPAVPEAKAPVVADEADQGADKLLLTPALRIVMADAAAQADPAPAQTVAAAPVAEALVLAPEMVAPVMDPAPAAKDQMISRLGAAVVEEEWESPEGDPQIWTDMAAVPERATFIHRPRGHQVTPDTAPVFMDPPQSSFAEVEDVLAEPSAPPSVEADPVPLRRVSVPPDTTAWADAAEAAVMADLAQEVADDASADLFEAAEPGMMAFDEEVLRDLVRDLIREELSGTLGERITRNVRKLVRAEIARALALREFE